MYNFVSRGGLSSIWNKRKYQSISINKIVSDLIGIHICRMSVGMYEKRHVCIGM